MKKISIILAAFVLALGLTQCKKENATSTTLDPNESGVPITLKLGGASNSRVDVTPEDENGWARVTFEVGDVIYVGYKGAKVGALTCQSIGETNTAAVFSGTVDIALSDPGDECLHFYLLGGKEFTAVEDPSNSNIVTVDISDQTHGYPVISYAPSTQNYFGPGTYTAKLMNKVSIMKFNVKTRSAAPICITGMNNKVTLNFNPATEGTDEGFTYGINPEDGGLIKMPAKDEYNETWAIVLPQAALEASETDGSANTFNYPYYYSSVRPAIHKIESNKYYHEGNDVIAITMNSRVVDLSKLTDAYTAQDGDTLTGALAGNYQISIADGATTNGVMLDGVTIEGENNEAYDWAGITCLGNATIILKDGTTNTVTGFYENYPGIYIAQYKTLTISGEGTLNASSNGWAAGIGFGNRKNCGNIIINSGIINAIGGNGYAGIGGGFDAQCGDITINGGNITAQGGNYGAGIGSGFANHANSECGSISINDGNVRATGGLGGAGIGSGFSHYASYNSKYTSRCGNISITGGTVIATGGTNGEYPQNSSTINGGAGIGTGYAQSNRGYSNCGTITIGSGVTRVKATMGNNAQYSIGKSSYNSSGTCGTVTIGGTVYYENNNFVGTGSTYLRQSPLVYPQ